MNKIREKMPPSHRAKQFMPFAAVKGLSEALAEKEIAYQAKIKLAEDAEDEVNRILSRLFPGSTAEISYYINDICKNVSGEILYIDPANHRLGISGINVYFSDIINISVPDNMPLNN